MSNKVLILDGESRTALAVSRSLGKSGYVLASCSHSSWQISSASKFVEYSFKCPNPSETPKEYGKWLLRTVASWKPQLLLPVTNASLEVVLEHYEVLKTKISIPIASPEACNKANDKAYLLNLAANLGIQVPKSEVLVNQSDSFASCKEAIQNFVYPACLKPKLSDTRTTSGIVKIRPSYPQDPDAVIRELNSLSHKDIDLLLQQYIKGSGLGVFALCWEGEVLCTFAHRRILEKPPSGGVSVLSESIKPEEAPVKEASLLLEKLNWHGVAMVEFKVDENSKTYLMEINPRFWGSLQLAIDCDRNFPKLLCQLALADDSQKESILEEIRNLPNFHVGRRLRWLLGCLDHLIIRFKEDPLKTLISLVSENSLKLKLNSKTRLEIFSLKDIQPFFREIGNYMTSLWSNKSS